MAVLLAAEESIWIQRSSLNSESTPPSTATSSIATTKTLSLWPTIRNITLLQQTSPSIFFPLRLAFAITINKSQG
jgi:hypothetical protein